DTTPRILDSRPPGPLARVTYRTGIRSFDTRRRPRPSCGSEGPADPEATLPTRDRSGANHPPGETLRERTADPGTLPAWPVGQNGDQSTPARRVESHRPPRAGLRPDARDSQQVVAGPPPDAQEPPGLPGG